MVARFGIQKWKWCIGAIYFVCIAFVLPLGQNVCSEGTLVALKENHLRLHSNKCIRFNWYYRFERHTHTFPQTAFRNASYIHRTSESNFPFAFNSRICIRIWFTHWHNTQKQSQFAHEFILLFQLLCHAQLMSISFASLFYVLSVQWIAVVSHVYSHTSVWWIVLILNVNWHWVCTPCDLFPIRFTGGSVNCLWIRCEHRSTHIKRFLHA